MSGKSRQKHLWHKIQELSGRQETDDVDDGSSIQTGRTRTTSQEDLVVSHGIYLSERMSFNGQIKCVVYNPTTKQFLVLYDDMRIILCHQSGERESFSSADSLDGIIFVPKTNRYIAWSNDGKLRILDASLSLISTIPANSDIFCLVYNEFGDEIITGNRGLITVWMFRSGNTILVPKLAIRSDLNPDDEVSLVTIEETSSKNQRCFAVVHNSVLVFRLKDGVCTEKLENLHKTYLTGAMFFRPLKLLITSGQDGSIKTWTESHNLKTVFVGHTKSVNKIMLYKYGPLFLSISNDESLRIWNLDTSDEVDDINVGSKLIGMHKHCTDDSFYTYTKSMIYLWKLNNVHSLATAVGSRVKTIKSTTHPNIPMRSVLICKDSCVRITCPKNGTVRTALVLPEGKVIQDAVYAISAETLFVLLKDGTILKSSTTTNPCKILERWDCKKTGATSQCQQLCLYEYVVQNQMTGNKWKDVTLEARGKKYAEDKAEVLDDGTVKIADNYDRVILFGGCVDGTVVVYEWQHSKRSGKVSFILQAHTEPVIAITANPGSNQIVTAGSDMCIKIWRVFPFAQEALAPLLLYMSSETATHLAVDERRLCVAFQEKSIAAYSIAMYRTKTSQKGRIEHLTEDEHTDVIVGVTVCPKLRLFASASIDGSIKIWSEMNKLIRIIKLNATPHSLCFSTQRGDLLVAIGSHVHKIPYSAYLPSTYLYQMAVMMFNDPPGDTTIPVTEESLASLTLEQRNRLLKAHSSLFKLSQFVDDLSDDEIKEREEENNVKEFEYRLLASRDEELRMLVNGTYPKKKRLAASISAKNDAWDKYLDLFYNRERIILPDDQKEQESEDDFIKRIPKKFSAEVGQTGFFSVKTNTPSLNKVRPYAHKSMAAQQQKVEPVYKESRSLSIAVDPEKENVMDDSAQRSETEQDTKRAHSAPSKRNLKDDSGQENSDVDQPTEVREPERKTKVIEVKGTNFQSNAETLHELSKQITDSLKKEESSGKNVKGEKLPIAPDGYLPNSVVVALYKEMDRKVSEEEEVVKYGHFRPRQLTSAQLEELMAHKKKKQPKLAVEEEEKEFYRPKSKYFGMLNIFRSSFDDDDSLRTPSLTPSPVASPEPGNKLTIEDVIDMDREIKPLKPIEKLIANVDPESPLDQEKILTPPPERPPLPSFITQFFGEKWFTHCFEVSDLEETSLAWTLSFFIRNLIDAIKKTDDWDIRREICEAIYLLYQQEGLDAETIKQIEEELLFILRGPSGKSNLDLERKFTASCLKILLAVSTFKTSTIVELMAHHVLGNAEIRYLIMSAFEKLGLKDPHGYFIKHLCTFSTFSVSDAKKKLVLIEQCSSWLKTWTDAFQKHITSLAGKIYRAHKGNVVRGTKSPETPERIKGILKPQPKKNAQNKQSKRRISFVSSDFMDDAARNISAIEAINYFCDVQHEAELQRLRDAELAKKKVEQTDRTKDTVLLLPRINGYASLARLGETHQSVCHPERETALSHDFRLPPIRTDSEDISVKSVLLHLKTLTLNPFPDFLDDLLYDPYGQSSLVTLRAAKKYFIPSHSYVQDIM